MRALCYTRPMPLVVLLHSALGLRPAVRDAADLLRDHGHRVIAPDYYDGRVFDAVQDGLAYRDAVGAGELRRRVWAVAADAGEPAVYAGFSLGASYAQRLVVTGAPALGAVLMHNAQPVSDFGAGAWPSDVPAQVHYARHDPWMSQEEVDALTRDLRRAHARFEIFVYPGDAHLFADPGTVDHDPVAARHMWDRVLAFLDGLPA